MLSKDTACFRRMSLTVLIVYSFSFVGCYSTNRGMLLRNERLPESKKLLAYKRDIIVFAQPKVTNPIVTFQALDTPTYSVRTIEKFQVVKKTTGLPGLLLSVAGIAMIYPVTRKDTIGKIFDSWEGTLAAGGAVALLYGLSLLAKGPSPVVTDETESGAESINYEDGYPKVVPNCNVSVIIQGVIREYEADLSGMIKVDLVKDYAMHTFDKPKTVHVDLKVDGLAPKRSFTFESTEWTVPFLRIKVKTGSILNEPNYLGSRLHEIKFGQIYRIVENADPSWFKIQFGESEGYVPVQAGSRFWTLP